MITNQLMVTAENSDAELVARSLNGDRDAFSQIVARYQTLVCSLAYSAMGNLGQSEDLAQETFITAWRHLGHLREPAKLRAWLCGIVRNRVRKSLHQEGREPVRIAEPLEETHESAAHEALPSEQTISKEEEAILWRSLEKIPENYREPLILFYREHKSIEHVAVELELSEDAVKQRLSRGRKLLHDEVVAFVEGALRQTAPGQAFSGAVLAALPLASVSTAAAGVGVAGKGTAAAKSGSLVAVLGVWLAPLIGIFGALMAHFLIVRAAPTPRERKIKMISFGILWAIVLGWAIGGQIILRALIQRFQWPDKTSYAVWFGFWWLYAAFLATWTVVMFRGIFTSLKQGALTTMMAMTAPMDKGRRILLLIGVYAACFSWLINLAWQARDVMSTIVITGLMIVLGAWQYVRVNRSNSHGNAVRITCQHMTIVWSVVLIALNLRLDLWLAAFRGVSLLEIHQLLPVWVMPAMTLALGLWVGLLIAITRPKDPACIQGAMAEG
jgi:RNA polymerase sigma factor (sigma-70 family)